MVFMRPDGSEVDRIVGARPPATFLADLDRFRRGDTTAAALTRLQHGRGNQRDLDRALSFLEGRGELREAVDLLERFRQGRGPACCEMRLLEDRLGLQDQIYDQAAASLLADEGSPPTVPAESGALGLWMLLQNTRSPSFDASTLRSQLREARRTDAGVVLAGLPLESIPLDQVFDVARMAFRHGNYYVAAGLYRRVVGDFSRADRWQLTFAAWNLYLASYDLPEALLWARGAYGLHHDVWSERTLARLEYVAGRRSEGIRLETNVVREMLEKRMLVNAHHENRVLEAMRSGRPLGEGAPFEDWPPAALSLPPLQSGR